MQRTKIQWCDFTSNPIKFRHRETGADVWACVKVSAGCAHCYAESFAKRMKRGGPFTVAEMAKVEPYVDERELRALLSTRRLPAGSKVFIEDMSDLFGPWVTDEMLDRVFAVMALTPHITYQVLTKRPERMRAYLSDEFRRPGQIINAAYYHVLHLLPACQEDSAVVDFWDGKLPLRNVWLGTSVEDQPAADKRIPELLATPAAVRFLSCEPLLSELVLVRWVNPRPLFLENHLDPNRPLVDWVIVGGESGTLARPCDLAWIRSIVAQCQAASVAVFVKQLGAKPYHGEEGFRCDGEPHAWAWMKLRDRHGANPDEWPPDLRVREFPGGVA